jgi:Uma2 family endonuclease
LRQREYRFTRQEVYKLCDEGWFADQRVNLIDGRIIVMPLPNPPHVFTLTRLRKHLESLVPSNCHYRTEQALAINRVNDPGPVYAIVTGSEEDYLREHPSTAIFIAEISDSTLRTDLGAKAELYAKAQIPEYWVLDVNHRRLIVHREPMLADSEISKQHYGTMITLSDRDTVAPLFAPQTPVTVASLFPPIEVSPS